MSGTPSSLAGEEKTELNWQVAGSHSQKAVAIWEKMKNISLEMAPETAPHRAVFSHSVYFNFKSRIQDLF